MDKQYEQLFRSQREVRRDEELKRKAKEATEYITVDIEGYKENVPIIFPKSKAVGGAASGKGFVYIITDGEAVKIGKTKDMKYRMSSMQTCNPRELFVLQVIRTNSMEKIEQSLHWWYRKYLIRGEWFDLLPIFGLMEV